jgi:hypothetical protein
MDKPLKTLIPASIFVAGVLSDVCARKKINVEKVGHRPALPRRPSDRVCVRAK